MQTIDIGKSISIVPESFTLVEDFHAEVAPLPDCCPVYYNATDTSHGLIPIDDDDDDDDVLALLFRIHSAPICCALRAG